MDKISMRNSSRLMILFLMNIAPLVSYAQFSFHNFGNIKMHENAQIGFHENLINDGSFDENLGLAGFYNSDVAFVSGAFKPVFNDLEIMVANNIFLEVGLGITNNGNFILGNVVTPRNLMDINLEYRNQAFYTGETELTKVDGYAAINNIQNFTFPTGTDVRLRPLQLSSNSVNNAAKSAYFEENPNNPSTFFTSFNTENRADILLAVSEHEFWDLDADVPSTVSLTWDTVSDLPSFLDDIENLRVVGWNSNSALWEDLGVTNLNGDLSAGTITSAIFVPNNYTVLTFGGSLSTQSITLGDFLLTPNGDGINDFLELKAVSLSPNNRLRIFNRWGRAVYEEENYNNLFDGTANVSAVINSDKKLPAGVYFYIINLFDIDFIHQGYLYIDQ